jgi:hypothetical protein
MRVTTVRALSAVVVGCIISSCSDSSAPVSPPATTAPTKLITGPTRLDVVTWDTPVTTAQSASAQIGPLGGQIRLPSLGLTVIFPAFALTSPTTITVTAVPGDEVAYEFEPHGTQFLLPVIVRQSLALTSASDDWGRIRGVLYGGYFADASALDQVGRTALVDEILRVSIDKLLGSATFTVTHFSGYLLGTGETSPSDFGGMH